MTATHARRGVELPAVDWPTLRQLVSSRGAGVLTTDDPRSLEVALDLLGVADAVVEVWLRPDMALHSNDGVPASGRGVVAALANGVSARWLERRGILLG